MSKYYLIKTDTNDKIDTELYLDKLSKGYVELSEEELKDIIKALDKITLDDTLSMKVEKVLKND